MGEFSSNLIKARATAGFDTAYKFYHRNGGRGHFPFTFVHYTRIEKGVSMPAPAALEYIFLALRLLPSQDAARQLLLSYLKDYLGRGADYILAPLMSAGGQPAADPLQWMKTHGSEHITPEEFKVMASDATTYWCAEALCNDARNWTPQALAAELGLKPEPVRKALEKLKKAGLAVYAGAGKFKCRHTGKFFTWPGRLTGMNAHLDAIKSYWDRAGKEGGRELFERLELIRAEEGAVFNYRLQLAQTLDNANGYSTHNKGDNTGFFLIETRIKKLKDF
ncbi:MAG: winged helix-turn-helix domain-containing protein [Elusimicrobia bacterium]|nr:winged helix-turn-helix domain-containing protein [Elusimicrobiota bacterium]